MNLEPLRPLADHLWQSTVFAAIAGLVTLALRNNRARVRHGVWLAAFCKFLIPVSALIALGGHFAWRTVLPVARPTVLIVANEVTRPFSGVATAVHIIPAASDRTDLVPAVLLGVWACAFAGIACSWFIGWRRIRAIAHAGSSVDLGLPIRSISYLTAPRADTSARRILASQ